MRHVVFSLLMLLMSVLPAVANDGGYVLHSDGYFRYGAGVDRYTRTLVTPAGYYYCGRWYPGVSYYQYALYVEPAPAQTVISAQSGYASNVSLLFKLAAARDKREGALRLTALEHASLKDMVASLGLTGNFRWEGYGQNVPYGSSTGLHGNQSLQLSSAGVQGNTVYGYSVNQISDFYGEKSTSVLAQQFGFATKRAQDLGGEAAANLAGIVSQDNQQRAKLAEIVLKSKATQDYLAALQGNGATVRTQVMYNQTGPSSNGAKLDSGPATMGNDGDLVTRWKVSATSRCAGCHANGNKRGGFDVFQYPTMNIDQKASVIHRLLTPDEVRHSETKAYSMPQTPDGHAAPRISVQEIGDWMSI